MSAMDSPRRLNAVPLGSGLPLVVRVLPRLLRGDGQHGENSSRCREPADSPGLSWEPSAMWLCSTIYQANFPNVSSKSRLEPDRGVF